MPPRKSSRAKFCSSCGGSLFLTDRSCPACHAPCRACPLCGNPPGAGTLVVRAIGRQKTIGVPFVASVTYDEHRDTLVRDVCAGCDGKIAAYRLLSWLLALAPTVVLTVVAGVRGSVWLWMGSGVLAIASFGGLFYCWVDGLVWGDQVLRRLGVRGRLELPATALFMLARAFIGFVVLFGVALASARPS